MTLDDRIKELVAVGASVAANCQPCLQYHVGAALQSGAGEQEIKAAIAVGKLVRRGAAGKMDKFIHSLNDAAPAEPTADNDCGCRK